MLNVCANLLYRHNCRKPNSDNKLHLLNHFSVLHLISLTVNTPIHMLLQHLNWEQIDYSPHKLLRNWEKKIPTNFKGIYLHDDWVDSIGWKLPHPKGVPQQKVVNSGTIKLWMHDNVILLVPHWACHVSTLAVLGCTTHYHMSWNYHFHASD